MTAKGIELNTSRIIDSPQFIEEYSQQLNLIMQTGITISISHTFPPAEGKYSITHF